MTDKYKHIIWDWNGTLFNDVNLCLEIINNILKKHSLESLTLNRYRDIFTFPVELYYSAAGLDLKNNSFDLLGMEWMKEYEERKYSCCLFTSAEGILKAVSDAGIEQSVLSAYRHETLLEILDNLKLTNYFKYISGLDHIYATSKLDNAVELMNKISCSPSEVLLVGDTLHDYETAKHIGSSCILIADGHQSKEKLLIPGVPVLDSLNALFTYEITPFPKTNRKTI